MLADTGEEGRLFAGGTALMLAMRQRVITPSHLVYIGGIEGMNGIAFDERNGLSIGPLARHVDVAESAVVQRHYPVLAAMAAKVANPQVRNQGTLGGNLCYGDPATDPPGCLMALGAEVHVLGADGERTIPLDEFYTDYYQTALEPSEVVTEIRVPPPHPDSRGAYTRFLLTPAEHRPLVSVAVVASVSGKVCTDVRIVVGASVPVPSRALRAEQFLTGKTITRDILDAAAEFVATDVQPLSDFRGSAEYRQAIIRTVVLRTAAKVFGI
jgi:carbon-monoxide dehydrogenase medium subunit